MRTCIAILALGLSVAACGGRTPGNQHVRADGGAGDAQPFGCELWTGDLTAANTFAVNRLGLGVSSNVAEGTLDEVRTEGGQHFVSFHVDHVWYGKQFLEGHDTWVGVDDLELASLSLPGDYVLGFRGNNFPLFDDDLQGLVWWHLSALLPAAQREDFGALIGYSSRQTPLVAVVQIVDQDADRTWFEVVEPLQGEFPPVFGDNWSTSLFPVSFPPPSTTEYLASVSGLGEYGGEHIGSVIDFREHTPDSRALVLSELASPVQFWDPDSAALAEEYGLGWTFKRAPHVLVTEVAGLADECCTGAGGTFVAHDILDVLQGTTARAFLVNGGHAYYGPEGCGDPYLLAVEGLDLLDGFNPADLVCDSSSVIDAYGSFALPSRVVQLEGSPENRQRLDAWLASAPPLLRLHPPDAPVAPQDVQQVGPSALWSVPVEAELALLAGSYLSWITVDEVVYVTESDHHEVTFSTTFSDYRSETSTLFRVKVAFRCGDPRLLQEGTDWLAPILFDQTPFLQGDPPIAYERGFVVPGLLLPTHTWIRQVVGAVASEIQ